MGQISVNKSMCFTSVYPVMFSQLNSKFSFIYFQYNKKDSNKKLKMSTSALQKRRYSQKIGSTCLSIEPPLAFSIQLKPTTSQISQGLINAQSSYTSPNSKSQSLKISRYSNNGLKQTDPKVKIKRAISASVPGSINSSPAQTSTQPVKALSNKFYSNWSFSNDIENCQKHDIKWIGVHPNPKNSENSHSQAFPRRPQKNADQSFANFILRYGRLLKHSYETKNIISFGQLTKGHNQSFKGATTKVKPRLTWFEKKKGIEPNNANGSANGIGNGSRYKWQNADNGKNNLEVVWWKDN